MKSKIFAVRIGRQSNNEFWRVGAYLRPYESDYGWTVNCTDATHATFGTRYEALHIKRMMSLRFSEIVTEIVCFVEEV